MSEQSFEMIAKTFQGLEETLAQDVVWYHSAATRK